ncbi:MAG: TolC family protein, partial [Ignavibacteriaceae bacterium]
LASLIGQRPEKEFSRFVATSEPPSSFPLGDAEELVEYALENNLDLKAAKKNIEASSDLADASGWEALPSFDLVGSLTSPGLGGNPQDVTFGETVFRAGTGGSFGDALSQVFKRKFPGWSIGFEFTLPIGLRQGLGERDRLEAGVINAKQSYIELSRKLEDRVRNSHRELSHGNERLKIAKEGVEAAQEQVRIGMIEFQNGSLSAFELVRLSEDFAVAQRRYSEALVKTVKAASDLKQLTSGWYLGTK